MHRPTFVFLALCFVICALVAVGCGDDDDSENGINPNTPCEELIYDICQAACECVDDCAWSSNGTFSSSTDFETCYDMEMTFDTCDGLEMDFEACANSISEDQCVEGPLGMRLELSFECVF